MKSEVTVLMSIYNSEKYLAGAIGSILNQSFFNFEFKIVDDGSDDNSKNIVACFNDKRIKYTSFPKNMGLTFRLQQALREINTPYLARMDADDVAKKDRLEKQVAFMKANPQVAFLGCNYEKIDQSGKILWTSHFPQKSEQIRRELFLANPFSHSCLIIRTNVLKKEGGYNKDFQFSQDYELALRLGERYRTANLPDVLMQDRQNPRAVSTMHRTQQALYFLKAQVLALTKYHYPAGNLFYLPRTLGYILKSTVI